MVSKQVVSWQVMVTMAEELIIDALQRAFWAQPPTPGLLVYSDRGGQYCGNGYRKLLHDHQALRSQSQRGDCYDNAQAEILWSRLKTEVLELRERPVLPTWLTRRPASPTILIIIITSACTPASAIRCPIILTSSFFNLTP